MRLIIASTLAALLTTTASYAADVVVSEPLPVVEPFTWTGFYVGGAVAYGFADIDVTGRSDLQGNPPSGGFDEAGLGGTVSIDPDDIAATLSVGYLAEFGAFVGGVEVEAGYLGIEEVQFDAPAIGGRPNPPRENLIDVEYGFYGLAKLRAGGTFGRALVTANVGLALVDVEAVYGDLDGGNIDVSDVSGLDESLFGYTVGGEVEYAVTDNVSLDFGYSFIDLEDETTANIDEGDDAFEFESELHVVSVGVNFRF